METPIEHLRCHILVPSVFDMQYAMRLEGLGWEADNNMSHAPQTPRHEMQGLHYETLRLYLRFFDHTCEESWWARGGRLLNEAYWGGLTGACWEASARV